jgi:hypothetical protein
MLLDSIKSQQKARKLKSKCPLFFTIDYSPFLPVIRVSPDIRVLRVKMSTKCPEIILIA